MYDIKKINLNIHRPIKVQSSTTIHTKITNKRFKVSNLAACCLFVSQAQNLNYRSVLLFKGEVDVRWSGNKSIASEEHPHSSAAWSAQTFVAYVWGFDVIYWCISHPNGGEGEVGQCSPLAVFKGHTCTCTWTRLHVCVLRDVWALHTSRWEPNKFSRT